MKLLNLFNSYITAHITAAATTVYVSSVTSIPTAPFHAILGHGTKNEEVVKVTAVVTTTKALTVVRAQAGTTAFAHRDSTLFHACEMDARMIHLDALTVTLVGTAGLNAVSLVVTDQLVLSSGRSRALSISLTSTGAKTGTAAIRTVAIDTTLSADTVGWTGIDLWMGGLSGDYTVGNVIGLSIYFDDLGENVTNLMALDIGLNHSAATASRDCFIRCREHTAIFSTVSVIKLEGANAAGYFISFDNPAETENSGKILETTSDGETATHRIRVHLEHTDEDKYIYLYPI